MRPGAGETAPCRKCVSLTSGRAVSRCTADDVPPRRAGAESTWPPRQAAAQASACHGGRERNSRLVCLSSQNLCTGDRAAGRIPAGSRPPVTSCPAHRADPAPRRAASARSPWRGGHRHPAGLLAVFEQFSQPLEFLPGSHRGQFQPRTSASSRMWRHPRWPRPAASQCGPGQEPATRRPPGARLPATRLGPASCPLVNCRSERPRARSRARLIGAGST
jgi:hypothetical protein